MPCEPKHVVVLSKETYQRLRTYAEARFAPLAQATPPPGQALAPEPVPAPVLPTLVHTPPATQLVNPTPPAKPDSNQHHDDTDPASKQPVSLPSTQEPEEVQEEESADEPQDIDINDDVGPTENVPIERSSGDPTRGIKPRYKKTALEVLTQLKKIPELTWDPQVKVGGKPQGVTISELLRIIAVPFIKGRIPPPVRHLLDRHKIKIRNHLASASPTSEWHPYFKL